MECSSAKGSITTLLQASLCLLAFTCIDPARSAEEIIFGGSSYYPPYHYPRGERQGEGFDVDVFLALTLELDWTPRFRFGAWTSIQQELLDGSIDIVPMIVSPARRERFLFTEPYNVDYHILFGSDNKEEITDLSLLSGLRVASEAGSYASAFLEETGVGAIIVGASSEIDALFMVMRGAADVALIPSAVGFYTLKNAQLQNLVILSPPMLPVSYAFALNQQGVELLPGIDAALTSLRRTGKLEDMRNKWLQQGERTASLSWWLLLVPATLLLGGIFLVWHYRGRLHNFSSYDRISGLPTRDFFSAQINSAIQRASAEAQILALVVIQFRDHEHIRYMLGDRASDDFIRQVAENLRRFHAGLVGHTGPGRFTVVLEAVDGKQSALSRVSSLLQKVSSGLEVEGLRMKVRVASGLALYPEHGDNAHSLSSRAVMAMTQAYKKGERPLVFAPEMAPDPFDYKLMSDLRHTLDEDGLTWVFQPKFCLKNQCIKGAEILVRWRHPDKGWISPDQFIPLAEQNGLIQYVTLKALSTAVQTLQHWHAAELWLTLSVNISVNDLVDTEMVDRIIQMGEGYEQWLKLEVTETAIMRDVQVVHSNLERLRRAGFGFCLDDYGTGYSSLEYLKLFHFEELKIDKTFIRNITTVERDLTLTKASISLGHDLGMQLVAEGVEDMQTASLLLGCGCDYLQGYLIAKPLPLNEFRSFIASFDMRVTA
jgi:diguanylate cyclase (GGDEF)-like protein